jgi:endonuclease YncB( thermonuclease family)
MGVLRVTGTIDVRQFWPDGESDADTTKVLVDVTSGRFEYQDATGQAFKPTHAFDGAVVHGRTQKDVVDNKGRVTIRLQGIDAPELHYRPQMTAGPPKPTDVQHAAFKDANGNFRQHFGETCAQALGAFLGKLGTTVPCHVDTRVQHPDDVFDTYGRFVGDIYVTKGGQDIDVNHWLVEEGWALPTFYDSMTTDEITTIVNLASDARKAKAGVYQHNSVATAIGAFDFTLRYERGEDVPHFQPFADSGSFIMPKLFRRQAAWAVHAKAKIVNETFPKYLQGLKDKCFLRSDFLAQGKQAPAHELSDFVNDSDKITRGAEDLVFDEATSKLFRNGKPVTAW